MRCHSPDYWKLLEPPVTPRILLDVPHPQYLKCMAALVCRSPPLSYIFIPMLWAVLACVAILPTTGKLLEPPGTPRILLDVPPPPPSTWNVWLHWCAGPPPPFIHFFPMLWAVLACVAILPTTGKLLEPPGSPGCAPPWVPEMYGCTGVQVPPLALGCAGMRCHSPYYWKLLEPPVTPRILLDVPPPPPPVPEMYGCTGVQVPPPFHTFYSHALGCVGMCCHSPYLLTYWNYWNHLELLGFSWMCPTPSTRNVWLHWCAGTNRKTRSWCWGVDSWGRRILRTMGWWRKVNLCSTLWVRLLKASDTIRLWNSMFDKNKTEVERAIRNGQGWIRSTHFKPSSTQGST